MRYTIFLCIAIALTLTISSRSLFAQTEVDERASIRFDKGLGFHAPDTTFGLNLRFRMQNRVGLTTFSETDLGIDEVDARIRRLRLRLDGYTKNQILTYYLQLSFSRGDQDWDNSGVPNIIRDAMIYYNINPGFYIGFGQGKLPGNRQRIISSGEQQFTDRSIVNGTFNIDRDFGLMAYYSKSLGGLHVNLKGAISSGEGRNALASDNGLAYTGRIELLPFGKFKDNGDFSEGDQSFELTPKLSFAGGFSFNHKAQRAAGQRGKYLHQQRDIKTWYIDAVFKYRGWAVYTEYMNRIANNPITYINDALENPINIYTGHGFLAQASYYFKNKFELGVRYSFISPNSQVSMVEQRTDEYTLGLTKYLYKHRVKLQSNIIYQQKGYILPEMATKDRWIIHFQIELGI